MSAAPLRIVHLNAEQGWRGGERQTFWLARALRDTGHHSVVAARRDSALWQRATAAGLETREINPRAPVDVLSAWKLGRELQAGGFHVLHAHTGNALTQGALARRGPKAVLIGSKRVDRPAHAGFMTRWKYRRADALIAVSSHVRSVLLEDGAPADRVTVVPDGVDLARSMKPADPSLLRQLGVSGKGPLIVMVAKLVPTKAPEMFVRALAEAHRQGARFEALLVGDGPLQVSLEQERDRLGLQDVLHFPGWRDDHEALIAAADIVALTSRGEGQGSVLLDAMQCGRPVLATRAGGIPDVVSDGETGLLVPVDDSAAFAAALVKLVADDGLRSRLGAQGRSRVQQFSIERMAQATTDVYRRALERR